MRGAVVGVCQICLDVKGELEGMVEITGDLGDVVLLDLLHIGLLVRIPHSPLNKMI